MNTAPAQIMGIVNCTPDSFYDGGKFSGTDKLVEYGLELLRQGADILDIGGESTRPGSEPVSANEEISRVIPVIEKLRENCDCVISIDTSKSEVAAAALEAGAQIVNDVTAGECSPDMFDVVAKAGAKIVLMHMQGSPKGMQDSPEYDNVVGEVKNYLVERAQIAQSKGISAKNIILDPGFGFGKVFEHNAILLSKLDEFCKTGYSLLVGMSRKSMIDQALSLPLEERLEPSLALAVMAVERGANILRVHDVRETHKAVRMVEAVLAVGD